jgi:hypothetical protein
MASLSLVSRWTIYHNVDNVLLCVSCSPSLPTRAKQRTLLVLECGRIHQEKAPLPEREGTYQHH